MKLILGVTIAILSQFADAQVATKIVDGYVSSVPVTILEITDIKVVDEFVSAEYLKSHIDVEVTGIYEGNGEEDTLLVQLNRTDDGWPMGMQKTSATILSAKLTTEAIPAGSTFITASSTPTPFSLTLRVRFATLDKFMKDKYLSASNDILFSYTKQIPEGQLKISKGISVRLTHERATQESKWTHYKIGF